MAASARMRVAVGRGSAVRATASYSRSPGGDALESGQIAVFAASEAEGVRLLKDLLGNLGITDYAVDTSKSNEDLDHRNWPVLNKPPRFMNKAVQRKASAAYSKYVGRLK